MLEIIIEIIKFNSKERKLLIYIYICIDRQRVNQLVERSLVDSLEFRIIVQVPQVDLGAHQNHGNVGSANSSHFRVPMGQHVIVGVGPHHREADDDNVGARVGVRSGCDGVYGAHCGEVYGEPSWWGLWGQLMWCLWG